MEGSNTYTTSTNPYLADSGLGSKYLDPGYLFDRGYTFLDKILSSEILPILNSILAFLSIIFLAIIIYVTIRMFEIRAKEHKHLAHEIYEYKKAQELEAEKKKVEPIFKDRRWSKVLESVFSDNSSDWKQAILEADNMLYDLLAQLGFQGDTLGEKLKDANRDSFRQLTSAWEVHNIRNKVAHEGATFELPHHEAKRVITMYESIFQDFGFI